MKTYHVAYHLPVAVAVDTVALVIETVALSVDTIALVVKTVVLSVGTVVLVVETVVLPVDTVAPVVETVVLPVDTVALVVDTVVLVIVFADRVDEIAVDISKKQGIILKHSYVEISRSFKIDLQFFLKLALFLFASVSTDRF
jgi:hypothetical protein